MVVYHKSWQELVASNKPFCSKRNMTEGVKWGGFCGQSLRQASSNHARVCGTTWGLQIEDHAPRHPNTCFRQYVRLLDQKTNQTFNRTHQVSSESSQSDKWYPKLMPENLGDFYPQKNGALCCWFPGNQNHPAVNLRCSFDQIGTQQGQLELTYSLRWTTVLPFWSELISRPIGILAHRTSNHDLGCIITSETKGI